MNRVYILGRLSSSEFVDSVPVEAKVGLPHSRIAEALDGALDVVKVWQVRRNNFTGMSFFEQLL